VAPAEAAAWIADKLEAVDDPEFRAIYVATDDAYGWRRTTRACRTRPPDRQWLRDRPPRPVPADPGVARLVGGPGRGELPAWDRLAKLMVS